MTENSGYAPSDSVANSRVDSKTPNDSPQNSATIFPLSCLLRHLPCYYGLIIPLHLLLYFCSSLPFPNLNRLRACRCRCCLCDTELRLSPKTRSRKFHLHCQSIRITSSYSSLIPTVPNRLACLAFAVKMPNHFSLRSNLGEED